jgi:CheY-like chemotaxis protein
MVDPLHAGGALLIAEPDFLLRRTVAGVLRSLGGHDVREVLNVDAAAQALDAGPQAGMLIALDDERRALDLLQAVRDGRTACARAMPVALMAAACDAGLALKLRELDVSRLLLKPYKVRTVLETVAQMLAAPQG